MDIILDDSSFIVDTVPIKLRIEVARSSKCVLIFTAGGSSVRLTIFRSYMAAYLARFD